MISHRMLWNHNLRLFHWAALVECTHAKYMIFVDNLLPQLWQSREAVPGLAKQRSAKIKHAAGEGFLAVRGLGISCGSRADLVQISCQPSVYSVVSSMSKSLSLLSSLFLSLSLLPLFSFVKYLQQLFNCRRRHNILGPTQALSLT